jgi:hypothetical protein
MPHLRSLHPLSAADIGVQAQLLVDCVEGGGKRPPKALLNDDYCMDMIA